MRCFRCGCYSSSASLLLLLHVAHVVFVIVVVSIATGRAMNNFWCLENAWLFIVLIVGAGRQQHANVNGIPLLRPHTRYHSLPSAFSSASQDPPPAQCHLAALGRRTDSASYTLRFRLPQRLLLDGLELLGTSRMHFAFLFIMFICCHLSHNNF